MTRPQIVAWSGLLFRRQLNKVLDYLESGMDVAHAENVVLKTYGDTVSVEDKGKNLLKFGRNVDLDTGVRETIWNQGGDETYVSTNIIDTISSSDAADTQTVEIEYHTVTGSGASQQFTFGVQEATLNGQNKVTLTTPCARVSRVRNEDNTAFAGDIYVYEDTAITGGVPSDATKIHAKAEAGDDQTFKASTTISNVDYLFITLVYASVKRNTAGIVDFRLETREPGGVFLPKFEFSVSQASGVAHIPLSPHIIVPKNYDVRITGNSSAANIQADAGFNGVLALITQPQLLQTETT